MNKMKLAWVLIISGFMMACGGKGGVPSDVLPQEKMQAVMWDMIRSGDFLNNFVFYRDTGVNKVAETRKWQDKIFEMHGITREQFKRSYTYYQQQPLMMKTMMDSISKIKVEPVAEDPQPETPSSSGDSLNKKGDSLRVPRNSRFRQLQVGKKLAGQK